MRTYIFGPVPSRRLGNSLGVDLTPTKTCSFDCLYCQLPATRYHTCQRQSFCSPDDVIKELSEVLTEIDKPDWITISGTGEPTLHADLGEIIDRIKLLRIAPVCVITNSSLFSIAEVRESLSRANHILPTLTTVCQETFEKIHRPAEKLSLEENLKGISMFQETFEGTTEFEIFVCPGMNDSDEEIEGLRNFLLPLKGNISVYLNTAVREPLDKRVSTAGKTLLNLFREKLNLAVPVTTAFEHSFVPQKATNWNRNIDDNDILKLLLRHPCSEEQLVKVLGTSFEKVTRLIEKLRKESKIKKLNNGDWSLTE
jgi:wyosine [tRNA(Phe)-imidazoG37] synthetase (radical SAM superfamily)